MAVADTCKNLISKPRRPSTPAPHYRPHWLNAIASHDGRIETTGPTDEEQPDTDTLIELRRKMNSTIRDTTMQRLLSNDVFNTSVHFIVR